MLNDESFKFTHGSDLNIERQWRSLLQTLNTPASLMRIYCRKNQDFVDFFSKLTPAQGGRII
jgi:phosphoenolpyruvate carboxylase